MPIEEAKKIIDKLISPITDLKIETVDALALTASNRKYYRVVLSDGKTFIATYNPDLRENNAFIKFSKSIALFSNKIPKVHSISDDGFWYIQDDFGDQTLYAWLQSNMSNAQFDQNKEKFYQKIIIDLIQLQTKGSETIDFNLAYPRTAFDRQSIQWDLNYFKYYFLKLSGLTFDEQLLENDFQSFTDQLLKVPSSFFMYRDFQSRNIMIHNEELYYIDYQGGRLGPLQYDLASLLFDAKANLTPAFREKMIQFYISQLPKDIRKEQVQFEADFWLFALIRVMQAMGAYGFRGLYEKKQHFINSIEPALINLTYILSKINSKENTSYLFDLLSKLKGAPTLKKYFKNDIENHLIVDIGSFSFKKGLPQSNNEHGGGFIFDCRSIHNPGRYQEYKHLTGKDKEVIAFFEAEPEMDQFLSHVYELVDASVSKYIDRGFEFLSIQFGCTGGQHRSVYAAEKLKAHLKQKFNVKLMIRHREQEK
ncbi:MAG: phosphotransferase [Bacteroidales bacterium]|nr:phosphotransferase [Bacteroidales bacterium]